jgi:hypothetical protein
MPVGTDDVPNLLGAEFRPGCHEPEGQTNPRCILPFPWLETAVSNECPSGTSTCRSQEHVVELDVRLINKSGKVVF